MVSECTADRILQSFCVEFSDKCNASVITFRVGQFSEQNSADDFCKRLEWKGKERNHRGTRIIGPSLTCGNFEFSRQVFGDSSSSKTKYELIHGRYS